MEVKTINDKIGLSAMYHTNESTSFGLSYLHLAKWQIIAIYNTPTSPISNYATGNFEAGIKIKLGKPSQR